MKNRISFIFLNPLFVILVIMIGIFFIATQGIFGDTIKIGIIADRTGPTVAVQGPIAMGIKTYFKYINEHGGVNGRKLKWIHEDDRYTISKQIAAFKKLMYRDKVFTMFLGGSTGGLLALQPMIKKDKITVLGAPTSDIMVIPPRKYYFTNGTSYEDEIKILFDYVYNKLKIKKPRIGLVRADTEHGKVGSRTANKMAKQRNTKLIEEVIVGPGAMDATSEALRFRVARIDYVLLHTTTGNGTAFVRSAKKVKFFPTYLGTKYAGAEDLVKLTGDASKNFHILNSFSRWYEDVPGVVEMKQIYEKHYPGKDRSGWYVQGWTSGIVIVEALKRTGKNLTSAGLIKGYESFKDVETKGLAGPITYGTGIRKGGDYVKLYKADVKNQRLKAITGWMRPSLPDRNISNSSPQRRR